MPNDVNGALPEWQRMRIAMVMQVTGLARSTIWAKVKRGEFPRPNRISQRVTVWNAAEVKAWLDDKVGGQQHAA